MRAITPAPRTKSPGKKIVTDKRAAILSAALRMFADRGVKGVAVPEIANDAGVAAGTIYRYFVSKEDLVNELYRQEKTGLHEHLQAVFERDYDGPKATFDAFWKRMVEFVRKYPHAYRFLELQDHRPYLDAESLALERRVLAPIVQRIKAGQRAGVYRDDVRERVLMSLAWGAFVNLFKSERNGLLSLRSKDLRAAREISWLIYTGQEG